MKWLAKKVGCLPNALSPQIPHNLFVLYFKWSSSIIVEWIYIWFDLVVKYIVLLLMISMIWMKHPYHLNDLLFILLLLLRCFVFLYYTKWLLDIDMKWTSKITIVMEKNQWMEKKKNKKKNDQNIWDLWRRKNVKYLLKWLMVSLVSWLKKIFFFQDLQKNDLQD